MNSSQIKQASSPKTNDELILVVKRNILFAQNNWQGFCPDITQPLIDLITQHQEFLPRSLMEQDATYKQIIPYIIFRHNERYFVMQRKATASEQRLKNKYTIGIGGHMRQEDMLNSSSIFDWAKREFHEEVEYTAPFTVTALGIINDDSTDVGTVHLGLALLIEGGSNQIQIKSELKSGFLISKEEVKNYYEQMESWSQIVFSFLNA